MKQQFIVCMVCLMIACSSCDKNFEQINTDPTKLSGRTMQFNYLLTSAELYACGNGDGYSAGVWESSLSYASTMMQQLSSTSAWWYGDKYVYNESYNAAYWRYQYATGVKAIVDAMNNIRDDTGKTNFYHIARILKVYLFQRITDLYGDVPYTEAGLGYISSTTTPRYDPQQDIYADLLKELDEAAAALSDGKANTVGNADIYYKGDEAGWEKFAYSEMLRLAMRMSKVAPDQAKTWAQKAVQGGVMENNDDNAICPH